MTKTPKELLGVVSPSEQGIGDEATFQIELKRASSAADPDDRTIKRLRESVEAPEKSQDLASCAKEPLLVEITKNGLPADLMSGLPETSSQFNLLRDRERVSQDKPPRMLNINSPLRQQQ